MAAARLGPTMRVMRRLAAALVVLFALSASIAAAQPGSATVTGTQLKAKFKASTGDKLLVNRKISYPGHYVAFDAGAASIAKKAKYGTFTIYLVTGADVEAEVTDLLADAHTGVLGTPSAGKIYWEAGSTLYGDLYWMAKRRYGDNVVLWWIGSKPVKKTDASFKRLHTFLTKATS
jgi:hypothetical protein